jgi:hypothetical protein
VEAAVATVHVAARSGRFAPTAKLRGVVPEPRCIVPNNHTNNLVDMLKQATLSLKESLLGLSPVEDEGWPSFSPAVSCCNIPK